MQSVFLLISFTAWSADGYTETAQAGSPDSWMTEEFNNQWGLESIGTHYAYARGYSGAGINIGIFDESVFTHPEFSGKLNKVDAAKPYNFSGIPDFPGLGDFIFGDHGTFVAGIAAAVRDGQGMHGVAYNSGLVSAKYLDSDNNYFEKLIQSNVRIFNNSWGSDIPVHQDGDGDDMYFPDGRPVYIKVTKQDAIGEFTAEDIDAINALSNSPVPSSGLDSEPSLYAALVRAARFGKLIVFAAGNENNYNVPVGESSIPYLFPDVLNNFITTANLTEDDMLDASSTSCGYTASYCISAPGADIYSTTAHTDYAHYGQTGEKKDYTNVWIGNWHVDGYPHGFRGGGGAHAAISLHDSVSDSHCVTHNRH